MTARALAAALLLGGLAAAPAAADDEFAFDSSEFEKKALEFGGYLEFKPERNWLNDDGSFYRLNFYDGRQREKLDRRSATLKLNAKLSRGISTVNLRASLEHTDDGLASDRVSRFDEAYVSLKPDPGFTLDLGKMALKWGKGYAWNPVGFVERQKDPNDVELAREGYSVIAADFIDNRDGALKTIAFTPLLLPVSSSINSDFGEPGHVNAAAKLYLLYRDTDIDFTWLSRGSRSPRFGVDFSRNLGSNLEIHGEWARLKDVARPVVDATGAARLERGDATSYLLGLRYLSDNDLTTIVEYYRNGSGYSATQNENFHALVDAGMRQFAATANDALLKRAAQLGAAGYGRANPLQDYLYLRLSQKEPFDIVYFTPSLTAIVSLDDHSYSLTPELLYTGINNLDLRLRAAWLNGGNGTEFGEKQNSRRLELMARFYF